MFSNHFFFFVAVQIICVFASIRRWLVMVVADSDLGLTLCCVVRLMQYSALAGILRRWLSDQPMLCSL